MTKCEFCRERVDAGQARGLVPGVDPDATPVCAVACLTRAIVFGDLDDPASPAARRLAEGGALPLMPECGTAPSVFYRAGDPA
jgi:phenylacetyl-CoA:acceptor oxidoreductase subunit 1